MRHYAIQLWSALGLFERWTLPQREKNYTANHAQVTPVLIFFFDQEYHITRNSQQWFTTHDVHTENIGPEKIVIGITQPTLQLASLTEQFFIIFCMVKSKKRCDEITRLKDMNSKHQEICMHNMELGISKYCLCCNLYSLTHVNTLNSMLRVLAC